MSHHLFFSPHLLLWKTVALRHASFSWLQNGSPKVPDDTSFFLHHFTVLVLCLFSSRFHSLGRFSWIRFLFSFLIIALVTKISSFPYQAHSCPPFLTARSLREPFSSAERFLSYFLPPPHFLIFAGLSWLVFTVSPSFENILLEVVFSDPSIFLP